MHLNVPTTAMPEDRREGLLCTVGVYGRAAGRVDDYPHQFSGGMRHRVALLSGVESRPS
jgi:ABC-type dipeptide/oligopeptide/nickel transport system ATPase component